MTNTGSPGPPDDGQLWEWCPDCHSYYTGSHICDQDRQAILRRVEAKLDQIIRTLEGRTLGPD